jgi:hypothetical protein
MIKFSHILALFRVKNANSFASFLDIGPRLHKNLIARHSSNKATDEKCVQLEKNGRHSI